MKRSYAFTLIELLVVIAIIAILAAILFPVFAKAKEAAKQSASVSNSKQVMLGLLMYSNDVDDTAPVDERFSIDSGDGAWLFDVAPGQYFSLWTTDIQPYIKSYAVLNDPLASGRPSPFSGDKWFTLGGHLGYNYSALSPIQPDQYSDGSNTDHWKRSPISLSSLEKPSQFVALASMFDLANDANYWNYGIGGLFGTVLNEMKVDGLACTSYNAFCFSGWASDGLLPYANNFPSEGGDPSHFTATTGLYTGGVAFRGSGVSTMAFGDGHVKTMNRGQASVGTNWYQGIASQDIQILDPTKYFWWPTNETPPNSNNNRLHRSLEVGTPMFGGSVARTRRNAK